MYNVSDQNKTKEITVIGHDSSMKMQSKFIIRKASCFLFEGGKKEEKICSNSNCKQQKKTNGCLRSL